MDTEKIWGVTIIVAICVAIIGAFMWLIQVTDNGEFNKTIKIGSCYRSISSSPFELGTVLCISNIKDEWVLIYKYKIDNFGDNQCSSSVLAVSKKLYETDINIRSAKYIGRVYELKELKPCNNGGL